MKHFIRTGHGESETFYTNPDEHFQGSGQGNGAGPSTWMCISIILINIINSFGVNATFCTAISGISIVLCAIMYVDDTDLAVTSSRYNYYKEVGRKAQALAVKWCSVLRITGGALRPEKCWWYLVSFQCRSDGSWKYAKIDETPATIEIPDYKMKKHRIQRYEVDKGQMGLGVYLAPDGSNREQVVYMKEKFQLGQKR